MDVLEKNKKKYIELDKLIYFKNIAKSHSNYSLLLDEFRQSFKDIEFKLNGKIIKKYTVLIEYILKNFNEYLVRILYFINKYTFSIIVNIIKNHYPKDSYVIFNDEKKNKLSVGLTLHCLCKQIIMTVYFNVIKVDKLRNINKHIVKSDIILDLMNLEPILLVLELVS